MTADLARTLVGSLLERIEADLRAEKPRFAGILSSIEIDAIKQLVQPEGGSPPIQSSVPTIAPTLLAVQPAVREELSEPVTSPAPVVQLLPRPNIPLNESAWASPTTPESGHILCIDFGTAKSKAFAALVNGELDEAQLIELPLGRRDGDIDGAVYTVASSIWIADDGLVFAGSEAMRRSMQSGVVGNSNRQRLDSVKQRLTLISVEQNLANQKLEPEINPTSVNLTYEDAICFYLAYLTDLATTELAERGHSRYMRRRFTIPAWQKEQRDWAAPMLAQLLARAQVLADTFHGHWAQGIPIETLKSTAAAAKGRENSLTYLLDGYDGKKGAFPRGLLEPLAAGSGRIRADRHDRKLVFVIDIGAGTTDFSLFWSVQSVERAFPIEPCGGAVRVAGDTIDSILVKELIRRVDGASDDWTRKIFETAIRLQGVRRLKETLFITGRLDISVADHSVSITLPEFLSSDPVVRFGAKIEEEIAAFLEKVDPSWHKADQALLVLTGGGSSLPMIRDLAKKTWKLGGRPLVFKLAPELPAVIEKFDIDFQREYPQLAVAIGGSLPILDERLTMREFPGAAPPPRTKAGWV